MQIYFCARFALIIHGIDLATRKIAERETGISSHKARRTVQRAEVGKMQFTYTDQGRSHTVGEL